MNRYKNKINSQFLSETLLTSMILILSHNSSNQRSKNRHNTIRKNVLNCFFLFKFLEKVEDYTEKIDDSDDDLFNLMDDDTQ